MVECNDKKCPIHGKVSVRGNLFTGVVTSTKPSKTAIIKRTIVKHVPKYERYKKSKSKIYAYNPECINAKEDDIVKVGETRKLSKTKSFVVLAVTGKRKTIKVEEDTFQEKEKKTEEKGRKEPEKEKQAEKKETERKEEKKEEKEEKKPEKENEAKEEKDKQAELK